MIRFVAPFMVAYGARGEKPTSAWLEFAPLKNIQVWRCSLYYSSCSGPSSRCRCGCRRYMINVYGVDITTAGMMATMFSLPASVFCRY